MAEWLKAAVLKTAVPETVPRVQISLPPPHQCFRKGLPMNIGFIGLGRMGTGMAESLLRAGHQVTVYNRTPEKARPLAERGARVASSVGEVCAQPVVFTMLADDPALEAVAYGEEGMLRRLKRGALHASSSTVSVELSARLARDHAAAGQRYVAAPVFGRPEAAAAAKLSVVAAGDAAAIAEIR